MKLFQKIILLTLFISISSPLTFAQFSSFGIKGGLNLSKLNYKDDLQGYNFTFREGLNSGLFGEYKLSNNLFIHGEIIYSMRGTEYGLDEKILLGLTIPKHKFIQKLDYIEIPILFQYNILIDSKIIPKVFLGPVASFLLSAKIEYVENDNSKGEVDQKDDIKSTELGVVFGVGANYNLSSGQIIFDIRYQYGLTNANNIEQGSKINSSTISINVGYGFNL